MSMSAETNAEKAKAQWIPQVISPEGTVRRWNKVVTSGSENEPPSAFLPEDEGGREGFSGFTKQKPQPKRYMPASTPPRTWLDRVADKY